MHNFFFHPEKGIIIYACMVLHCFMYMTNNFCEIVCHSPLAVIIYIYIIYINTKRERYISFVQRSAGVIAGIVIGVLVGIGCCCVLVCCSVAGPHKWRLDSTKAIHQLYILSICLHYDHFLFYLIS